MDSNPKDIIGIVKELQSVEQSIVEKQWDVNEYDGFEFNIDSTAPVEHAQFIADLRNNFPAIAQALLDAVEALEECSRRDEHLQIVKPIADAALHKIRNGL